MNNEGGAEAGFTLAEVLVCSFFVLLFGAMLQQFSLAMLRAVGLAEEIGHAQEAGRVTCELMIGEMRQAGYDGAGGRLVPLRVAARDRLDLQADLNGDGDLFDAHEIVSYRYDAERQALMRASGGGAPQPLLENVPPDAFEVLYYGEGGVRLGSDLTTVAERGRVRRVDLRLAVGYRIADSPELRVVAQTATVQLRNGE
jgi:hypothetical protein